MIKETLPSQIQVGVNAAAENLEARFTKGQEALERSIASLLEGQRQLQAELKASTAARALSGSEPHIPSSVGNLGVSFNSPRTMGDIGMAGGGDGARVSRGFEVPSGFQGTFGESRGGGITETQATTGPNWKYRRLEFPVFEGGNPDGWILRAERYFDFYHLTEEEKVEAAVVGLDGDALLWYQWENQRRPILRWTELKALIYRQFRPSHQGTLYEQWLAVEQVGTVEDYRREFIGKAAPLERIPEPILLGAFIRGLREEVKREIRVLNPDSLEGAMELAVRVDQKLGLREKESGVEEVIRPNDYSGPSYLMSPTKIPPQFHAQNQLNGSSTKPYPTYPKNATNPWSNQTHQPAQNPIYPTNPIRRLTAREMQEKREKGLCFKCDGKWSLNHQCKRGELSVLVGQERDEGGEWELVAKEVEESPPIEPPWCD